MEQVFRIEIPVEVVDKTDTAALQHLESVLQKIFASMQKNKTTANEVFNALEQGASEVRSAMNTVASATDKVSDGYSDVAESAADAGNQQEQAASEAGQAVGNIDTKLGTVTTTYKQVGKSAADAGQKSGSAFNQAGSGVDKFTQRMQKSEQTLKGMFREKIKLTLAAIDKASPILKNIWNSAKGLAGKAWHVAVRMKDFVTAPFRKLYNMISSPITMALSIAGVGFSAGDLISTFSDFKTGMSSVRALTGATGEDFLLLEQTAKNLGATTAFSATQASEGMQYLAMAGWETSEIVAAMPGLLDLAAAGATDLGTAADIVSDVMTAMGMSADQASRAADVFAKTATSSNTTIEGLGNTLKYAAPIAYSFGMTLEDVAAAAGLMANAGIKGEMAGTALRSSLLRMSKPTSDMAKTMKSLNISFDDGKGKMKDMSSIVRMLETSFAGLSESQRLEAAQTLFGTEAASAWLGIINQGADAYDEMASSLYNASGAAKEMAETRLDNLAGDMTLLQSAVEGMKIELVEKLNPYLRSGVQWLTSKIPAIQATIERFIDSAVSKVRSLKEHLSNVFGSSEFQNADGFAEKFFVAWDKIIAEPFGNWWNSGGQEKMLGSIAKFGENAGKLLHGVIAGIFAAIKGEDIDFEGLNITGLAKAGAEAAKTFVSSFLGAIDIGGLAGQMPGFMQAGLAGFGAINIGRAGFGISRTINGLRTAFGGVAAPAAKAATATVGVGKAAATSAVGIGKGVSILGGLKAALAAIPVWGWVAAAAITTAAIAIGAYSIAQEKHRQELLHMGDGVEEAANTYIESAQRVTDFNDTLGGIKEIELKIKQGASNQQVITTIQAQLAEIESRKVWLEAQLASGTLTPEQIAAYQAELDMLHGKEVELTAKLAESRVRAVDVQNYISELSALQSREEEISMALEKGVTSEEAAAYMRELEIIQSRKATITVALEGLGVTSLGIAFTSGLIDGINAKTAEVKVLMSESSLTQSEINDYTSSLAEIKTRQAEIDLQLTGSSLEPDQVKAYKESLDGIQSRTAEIEAKIAQGGLTESEIKTLSDEYAKLKTKEAEITLLLSGQGLTQEQLGAICEEYEGLDSKEAIILAKLSEAGMTDEEIQSVADAMAEIGDKQALLTVSFATGSLDQDALDTYNASLQTMYDKMVEISGGMITQEDVEAGRVTEERVQQVEQSLALQAETDLIKLQTTVEAGRTTIPEQVSAREGYKQSYEIAQATQDNLSTARANLTQLESERANLIAQEGLKWQQADSGTISMDAYDDWYSDMFQPGIINLQERYKTEVAPYAHDEYGMPVTGMEAGHFDRLLGDDAFASKIQDIFDAEERAKGVTSSRQADYDTQNASLIQQYQGEKSLVEGQIFAGSQLAGQSLEQLAVNYTQLDEAGRQMFEDAVMALETLNAQTDYIGEGEKTQAIDVVELAAKAEVMSQVQTQVQDIATNYMTMTTEQKATFEASEEGAAALAAVNSALESIGLDKIENLGQINEALEVLSTVDLSSFSLADAQAAFVSCGDDATGCKTQVDELRTALSNLDGKTATTHVYNYEHNITTYSTGGKGGSVAKNAYGGIYDGAFLSWVAEDGPEAIIPLGADKRGRGLDLWMRAGEALGVAEFADGGIVAPYSGALEKLPDDIWDDDDWGDLPKPIPAGPRGGGNRSSSVQVSIAANPVYHIEGGGDEDIIQKLKAHQRELAEIVVNEFAEQLEDIVTNV